MQPETKLISLYLDHPKVGCGWRRYVVLTVGPKWARLVSAETAEAIRIPAKELATGRPLPIKPTRAARRLRDVAKTYGEDTSAVREAMAVLRQR